MKRRIALVLLTVVLIIAVVAPASTEECIDDPNIYCYSICDTFWEWCVESSAKNTCVVFYPGCASSTGLWECCKFGPGM